MGHSPTSPSARAGFNCINELLIIANRINGVWGAALIGFPEGESRYRPGPAGGIGLGNGFKGKAFIKIDGFIYKVLTVT